ncbi:MAG: twin-arginine translocase TatA/TatE family subunit, partial [Alistipes sp.]|nr:twin-arginine translocase TatA/TatE family subunit [Alistipes sp.]
MKLLLFGNIGGTEILLIVLLVLLLFGGTKIPELMRGIGKGVKLNLYGVNDTRTDKIIRYTVEDDTGKVIVSGEALVK